MYIIFFFLLFLSGFHVHGAGTCAKDFYVDTMPGLTKDYALTYKQWAGHILTDNTSNTNLFFWLVEAEQKFSPEKLVIWLNGGPGCSSMDGMFLEVGPWLVTKDASDQLVVNPNPNSWTKSAHVLFVDQPVGTGYSFSGSGSRMHTQKEIAANFLSFIQEFLKIFPQYRRMELYLSGESFAGVYIPYIAQAIAESNNVNSEKINLVGLAIGNGWIDPLRQYEAYIPFAEKYGLLTGSHKAQAEQDMVACRAQYQMAERIKTSACDSILDEIITESREGGKMCINVYDIRLHDTVPDGQCGLFDWPPRLQEMKAYLSRDDVKKALNAQGDTKKGSWVECDDSVSFALDQDPSPPSYTLFPELLKTVKIMLFSGDKDLICNYMGTERLIDYLTWNGHKGWESQHSMISWMVDGEAAGLNQTERNLTYIKFYNASHMVAVDNPKATLDMISRFIGAYSATSNNTTDEEVPEEEEPKKPVQHYYLLGGLMLLFVAGFAGVAGYLFFKGRESAMQDDLEAIRGGSWHELEEENGEFFHDNDVSDDER